MEKFIFIGFHKNYSERFRKLWYNNAVGKDRGEMKGPLLTRAKNMGEKKMTIRDIISLLDAEIISAADLDLEVKTACGSDMMSDVLAFVKDQSVLLTG